MAICVVYNFTRLNSITFGTHASLLDISSEVAIGILEHEPVVVSLLLLLLLASTVVVVGVRVVQRAAEGNGRAAGPQLLQGNLGVGRNDGRRTVLPAPGDRADVVVDVVAAAGVSGVLLGDDADATGSPTGSSTSVEHGASRTAGVVVAENAETQNEKPLAFGGLNLSILRSARSAKLSFTRLTLFVFPSCNEMCSSSTGSPRAASFLSIKGSNGYYKVSQPDLPSPTLDELWVAVASIASAF